MITPLNARELWVTDPSRKFSGKAPGENGATVEIVVDKVVHTVIVTNGEWTWSPTQPFTEGDHVMSVRIIDRAGNIGAPTMFLMHVDTTAPDAPVILQVVDNAGDHTGMLNPGDKTDDTTPSLKGVAEPGSVVKIYNGEQVIGSAVADKNGLWQLDVELAEGTHELRAEATDGRGHTGPKSAAFTLTVEVRPEGIDTPPIIGEVYDDVGPGTGALNPGDYTNDSQPTLSGTGTPGLKVDIFDNNVKIGSADVDAAGKWQFTPASELADGAHAFRVAHQGSEVQSAEWTLILDTQPPEAPEIFALMLDALLSHASEELLIDNGKTQRVLEADAADTTQLASAIKNSDGSWVQQAGSLTVAGVQYQVYSHSGSETELLVQQEG